MLNLVLISISNTHFLSRLRHRKKWTTLEMDGFDIAFFKS